MDTENPKSPILVSEEGKQAVLRYLRSRGETGTPSGGGTKPGKRHDIINYRRVTGA